MSFVQEIEIDVPNRPIVFVVDVPVVEEIP